MSMHEISFRTVLFDEGSDPSLLVPIVVNGKQAFFSMHLQNGVPVVVVASSPDAPVEAVADLTGLVERMLSSCPTSVLA